MKDYVVTADDVEALATVNDAHQQLTHTHTNHDHLMEQEAPACDDAVERARRLPQLQASAYI